MAEMRDMTIGELSALVERGDLYRARAVFELSARAATDEAAVVALGALSRLAAARDDRLFQVVSLAWAAVIGLLAAETPLARQTAYAAFAELDPEDRGDLLTYLRAERIEDAHPDPL